MSTNKEQEMKFGGATGWEGKEPAPLEFMHSELMEVFHQYRHDNGLETSFMINGNILSRMIAKAKMATYEKYPKQVNRNPVLTTEL